MRARDSSFDFADYLPQIRVEMIVAEYERRVGAPVERPLTGESRLRVAAWFRQRRGEYNFYRLEPTVRWMAHIDAGEKGSSLVQSSCMACERRGTYDRQFPINVDPWTNQSRQDKARTVAAVRDGIGRSADSQLATGPLCVSVVCNVANRPGAKRKDVDNLVKGLLDSMNGVVFEDDSSIQCLSVRRLETKAQRGLYSVRVVEVFGYGDDCLSDAGAEPQVFWGERVELGPSIGGGSAKSDHSAE